MSDEIDNNDPLEEAPGWASPNNGQGNGQSPTPQQPTPPPASNPPSVPEPPMYQQPPAAQPPFQQSQPGYDPFANQGAPQYPQPKKKRKLWLWITLGILIPLLLCGAGIGGCAYFVVGQTKPAIDVTNKFYKAAKEGKDLDPYTCQEFVDQGGFNVYFDDEEANSGKIQSYNFSNVNNTNGIVTVKGTVTRNGVAHVTTVQVTKDNGKSKVCYVQEK